MDKSDNERAESEPLRSWKAIANYLNRRVRTVQRWERHEGLPIHRHQHQKQATVYAYKHELDAWLIDRDQPQTKTENRAKPNYAFVAAIIVALALTAWAFVTLTPDRTSNRAMLVVLPFDNLTADERMQFLSDGLTEELSTQLSKTDHNALSVIARTSALSYRNRSVSVSVIRGELGVDYVLEGSIRREAESIRVTAQLIETRTQTHVWADSFDFAEDSWLSLQDRATERVVADVIRALDLQTEFEVEVTDRTLEAQEHVLLGHGYRDDFSGAQIPKAIEHFNNAIAIDDRSIDAYLGLALSYAALAFYEAVPLRDGYGKAREYALTSLELDPSNGEAVAVLGWIRFVYDWDWPAAEAQLKRAIELRPNSHWTHWMYSNYLSAMGDHDNAIAHARRAHQIDPVSVLSNGSLGYILTNAKRYEDSEAVLAPFIERSGGFGAEFLINTYDFGQDYQSAIDLLRTLDGNLAAQAERKFRSDGAAGYWTAWREHYERIENDNPDFFHWRYAVVLSKLGETDKAMDILEKGFHQRSGAMTFIPAYPLEPLHDQPRFQALLERMDLYGIE